MENIIRDNTIKYELKNRKMENRIECHARKAGWEFQHGETPESSYSLKAILTKTTNGWDEW